MKIASLAIALVFSICLAVLAACGDGGVGAPGIEPSPTATAEEPTTAGSITACPGAEELAVYWPPQGTVTYFERLPRIDVDVPPVPFDQVQVLAIACGDARGQGQDAYIAYQVELPPGSLSEESVVLTALAALRQVEGSLVNIGTLPEGMPPCSLRLQDVTGDGRDEIIFERPGGATWATTSVWSWREGNFQEVFRGVNYLLGPEFRDLNGDGSLELVVGGRRIEDEFSMRWPTVYRWDGHSFGPALFPAVYDEVIAAYLNSLQSGTPNPDSEVALRTTLGHLYERQGRTAEARVEYERAWALYEATGHQPGSCADAAQAVQEFYLAIGQGVGAGTGLSSAYSMLAASFRRAQPFPDFAAGFARIEDVILREPPKVIAQDEELSRVSVRGVTYELTPQGEVIGRFADTWRVRQEGESCTLESDWPR